MERTIRNDYSMNLFGRAVLETANVLHYFDQLWYRNIFDTQANLLEDTLKKILMNEYISSIIASTVWLNVDIY